MAEFERAAVIGTGTMGPGMGAVLARVGHPHGDVRRERRRDRARQGRGRALAQGVLERLEAPAAPGGSVTLRVRPRRRPRRARTSSSRPFRSASSSSTRSSASSSSTWRPDAVLASNTSGIPITAIAEACEHPERVIGNHWSNPPHLIPMIEVIPGERTSQEVVDAHLRADP